MDGRTIGKRLGLPLGAASAALWRTRKNWARFILVVSILVAGMVLGRFAMQNAIVQEIVRHYGYAGIFLIAVVSGFNLVVPIPAVAFVPLFLASGMDFWTTIIVIVVGVTLADSTAFLLGKAGRELDAAKNSAVARKLARIRERHYGKPLILMFLYASFAPLPNEVMAIPLGFMGYPLGHIIPPLLLGNFVFNTLSALGIATVFNSI